MTGCSIGLGGKASLLDSNYQMRRFGIEMPSTEAARPRIFFVQFAGLPFPLKTINRNQKFVYHARSRPR